MAQRVEVGEGLKIMPLIFSSTSKIYGWLLAVQPSFSFLLCVTSSRIQIWWSNTNLDFAKKVLHWIVKIIFLQNFPKEHNLKTIYLLTVKLLKPLRGCKYTPLALDFIFIFDGTRLTSFAISDNPSHATLMENRFTMMSLHYFDTDKGVSDMTSLWILQLLPVTSICCAKPLIDYITVQLMFKRGSLVCCSVTDFRSDFWDGNFATDWRLCQVELFILCKL